ncbi:MAG: hypothetical protein ACFCGT_09505 [Sandaracinaceae bacterium]
MKRTLKFLHEVGSVGLMGAAAAQLILSFRAEGLPPEEVATLRLAILVISEWLLLPSFLLVILSGLLALAAHRGYQSSAWAWMKAATTVLLLECTLVSVQGPAQTAARVARQIAEGHVEHAHVLGNVLRHERGGLTVLLLLSVANIALAVWRPTLRRRRGRAGQPRPATAEAAGSEPSTDAAS